MTDSSQKFIARNRAPRVQIEYDVELYGSEKKVQLPFVMGVMSDLAGKSKLEQPAIADRSFLEIDVDNFDDRMRAMQPRAAFSVPNTLTGEGSIPVDLTFEKMDDFSPAAIAARVEPLRPLLEARTQLSNLMAYMDGKAGAETLIEKILADPSLLGAISGAAAGGADQDAALASLRALTPAEAQDTDTAGDVLDALRAQTPEDTPAVDPTANVLSNLAAGTVPETPPDDTSGGVLDGLRQATPDKAPEDTAQDDALAGLRDLPPIEEAQDTQTADALAVLAAAPVVETEEPDAAVSALDSLAAVEIPEVEVDTIDDLLADLAGAAPDAAPEPDTAAAALDSLVAVAIPEAEVDTTDDLLADLAGAAPDAAPEPDAAAAALDSLAAVEISEAEVDTTDDLLADLADAAPDEAPEPDAAAAALDSLVGVEIPEAEVDSTDDLLADLAGAAPDAAPEPDAAVSALDSLAAVAIPEAGVDTTDDLLADLAGAAPDAAPEPDAATAALDSLAAVEIPEAEVDSTDDLLADLADAAPDEAPEPDVAAAALDSLADVEMPSDGLGDLDDLLGGDGLDDLLGGDDLGDDTRERPDSAEPAADDLGGLDDLLGGGDLNDLLGPDDPVEDTSETPGSVDAVSDDDGLDDLLGGDDSGEDPPETPVSLEAEADDLDDLLSEDDADNETSEVPESAEPATDDLGDLDDLLGGDGLDDLLGGDDAIEDTPEEPEPTEAAADDLGDLDDLLGDLDTGDDNGLDDLLGDLEDTTADDDAVAPAASEATLSEEPEFAYGQLSTDRPDPARLNRKRFRLAILGDFSGRAARGQLETGDALAARRPILLDPDTVEDVIEGFATDLVLPIGKDSAGVAVKLGGLDDLHPDELYENVEIFAELVGLRGQLSNGATAENAARQLREWGEKHGTPVAPTRSRSSGNAVPADRKLSDFQKLIGDAGGTLTQAAPLDEMMARIVGPHIRAIPDADAVAMQGAVDQALSAAMRLVLHHPEFQSVEAQWRSIDLIARSVEVDDTLDVMLYDVSAEEIAADLATSDDLATSGFVRLLTDEPLDEENGRGGYSALIGLYTFEETPPHAELLGRIARVAAHVDAPFIAAISPAFLDTEKKDRHPLVVNAWDTLRAMPEAGHLGLASPRFLLRRPYGAKTEPIYEFEFEEFTMAEGLKGMLWANPVVLVAILLAKSFRQNGASMNLGSIMSLGEMPYHYINDRYGDQVALPCTERNLTLDKVEQAVARGFMSVVSIKGRDEIRLASFQSLAGAEILGPWSGVAPPPPSPPKPEPAAAPAPEAVDSDDGSGDDVDLDDLLAGFGDDLDLGSGDDGDTDADLAALLEDL